MIKSLTEYLALDAELRASELDRMAKEHAEMLEYLKALYMVSEPDGMEFQEHHVKTLKILIDKIKNG